MNTLALTEIVDELRRNARKIRAGRQCWLGETADDLDNLAARLMDQVYEAQAQGAQR